MKTVNTATIFLFLCYMLFSCTPSHESEKGLKEYYNENYLIGTALYPEDFGDPESNSLVMQEFNSITPENDMKWERIHPTWEEYTFDRADKIVEYTQTNNIKLVGHTLVWHSQMGKGVFAQTDAPEDTVLVDSATLMNRVKEHITTVAGRYKGKIYGWDVVNEALNEDGTLRESNFLKIAGKGYIEKAFEFANEVDPGAELYYNDYNMVEPEKRAGAIDLIKKLQKKGIRIDGVGLQAHWELDYPSLQQIEESILDYSELGIKVMFTELDISVLPSPWRMPSADISIRFKNNETMNPFVNGMPDSIDAALAKRYRDIFELFNKHKDKISRVTFWGLHDGNSWKNGFPIKGRTDYPLLFDRHLQPKAAYYEVVHLIE